MKIAALAVAFAAAVALTYAAECTEADFNAWAKGADAMAAGEACGVDVTDTSNQVDPAQVCSNSKCLAALEAVYKNAPDCTIMGINLATTVGQNSDIIKQACDAFKAAGSPSAPIPGATPATSSTNTPVGTPAATSSAIDVTTASAGAIVTAAVAFYAMT